MSEKIQYAWWALVVVAAVLTSPFFYIRRRRNPTTAPQWGKIARSSLLYLLPLLLYLLWQRNV